MSNHVFAAGTIPWRKVKHKSGETRIEVLLVYRKNYRDWSFPKGKVDPNESLPQTAVRETREETGLRIKLGVNLGNISYKIGGRRQKIVQYWAAKATKKALKNHKFKKNSEISEIAWVPLSQVNERLSYDRDRDIFSIFCDLYECQRLETFAVVLLRHAKAEPRGREFPVDHLRPLADIGADQAQLVVPPLAAFGAKRVISSDAKRCRSTATPIAHK
ncbi:MAG: NUDIX domain-containing protein, partial [Microbacteriaceae bacterium]|nr:NUDIX domain-containing protein [Microbacteriaceae bacterium]